MRGVKAAAWLAALEVAPFHPTPFRHLYERSDCGTTSLHILADQK
jgi:hypothetical protein